MRFLVRLLLNGVAVFIAANVVPGITVSGPGAALIAGVILGFVNAIVRPLLFILTLPFTLITLGLFIFVINAACLALTAALMPGFSIDGFFAAFAGALLVTIVSWILNALLVGAAEKPT